MKVLVACFQKCGSTYLTELIGGLPGFQVVSFVPIHGRREQELDETKIVAQCNSENQVAQHHVRASEYTLNLISQYNITPIVLVRNIYDVCVSFADHIKNESPIVPTAYFDESFRELSFEDRVAAVVDLAVPWHFSFYVSWWKAKPEAMVAYEDLILGSFERKQQFLARVGIDASIGDIVASHAKAFGDAGRLNVGRQGRGKRFTSHHEKHMQRLASHSPDVDFSLMGLEPMQKRHRWFLVSSLTRERT